MVTAHQIAMMGYRVSQDTSNRGLNGVRKTQQNNAVHIQFLLEVIVNIKELENQQDLFLACISSMISILCNTRRGSSTEPRSNSCVTLGDRNYMHNNAIELIPDFIGEKVSLEDDYVSSFTQDNAP